MQHYADGGFKVVINSFLLDYPQELCEAVYILCIN